jgi:Glu-tRNA(Gln) amidotransferase subunit E-like FAD-binding protein
MNLSSISQELRTLVSKANEFDGSSPSAALETFLKDLENGSLIFSKDTAEAKPKRRASTSKAKPKKDAETVARTISELSSKLRAAFTSDDSFEQTVQALETSGLSKENVIELYNSVFGANKTFPKSVTKQALFNAIRKDRIAKVRAS